jgi:hypothetical protein
MKIKLGRGWPLSEIGILLFLHQLLYFFDHVELLTAKNYFSLSFNL